MSSEDLLNAAERGDVEFLINCVASDKPTEYYLTRRETEEKRRDFLHLAVANNRLEFVREAVQNLPAEIIQRVIEQAISENSHNHLHKAATIGNLEMVKVLLDFYRGLPSLPEAKRPWLAKSEGKETPCHMAIWFHHEECGLEIWRMDRKLLSETLLEDGTPLLLLLVLHGLQNWALEMLSTPFEFSCSGTNGKTAFRFVPHCSDEELLRQLLKRYPKLFIEKEYEEGESALHYWAKKKKLWPFECLLRSADIFPDVRKVFVELMSAKDNKGFNPLHTLAALDETSSNQNDVGNSSYIIAKFLIENYKQEIASPSSSSEDMLPWLMEDYEGRTPLFHAILHKKEEFAVCILEVDNHALKKTPNCLRLAIEKGCHQVFKQILDIMDAHGWSPTDRLNALHLAPLCPSDLFDRLLSQHSELLEEANKDGETVLHEWVKLGQVWALEYLMHHNRSEFVRLIGKRDVYLNYPLHVAASATSTHHEAAYEMAQLLVVAHIQENPSWVYEPFFTSIPWFCMNGALYGPMHLAITNQHEKLASYFLSLASQLNRPISELLDYYTPVHNTLFLAVKNNCFQVAQKILTQLDEQSWSTYITDSSNGQTIFHLLPHCKDQESVGRLLENAPIMVVTKADGRGRTALHEASAEGADWLIKAILEKHPSAFDETPLAWVEACKKGHIAALEAFINHNPGKFRDVCIKRKDSPLHYDLRFPNLTECEKFLHLPGIKYLINLQNDDGATPLHKAVRNRNINMTEALLNMDNILQDIKDKHKATGADLVARVCEEELEWDQMCKRNGFDPWIKTAFFKRKTNLVDARTALFVVAALLATITFTAGFTLPGGFDQEHGHAVLAKKPVFLVFLVSDALALCCSILVLMCLIWSLFFGSNNDSLIFIDSSMVLLLMALFFTLLAFMTGVYVVIAPKKLWAAILILVICSLIILCLIGFSAYNKLLNKVLSFFRKRRPHQDAELGFRNSTGDGDHELTHLLPHQSASSNQGQPSTN